MSLFNKIRDFMGSDDDDFLEDDEEEMDIITKAEKVREYDREEKRDSIADLKRESSKVVNINTTAQFQVILVKPERFDDAAGIADHLNEKRTIVLNLESTNKDVSRRLVDFLSGVAYANGGQIKKVANSTFIITPYNVDIMGDLLDELESTGIFY